MLWERRLRVEAVVSERSGSYLGWGSGRVTGALDSDCCLRAEKEVLWLCEQR